MGRIKPWCSVFSRRATNETAKTALLASGVIVFVQFALFLVLGVMLFVYAQHGGLADAGSDADRIFPEFIVRDMPRRLVAAWFSRRFSRSPCRTQAVR